MKRLEEKNKPNIQRHAYVIIQQMSLKEKNSLIDSIFIGVGNELVFK